MKHLFVKGRESNSSSTFRAAAGLTPKPLTHATQHVFLIQGTAAISSLHRFTMVALAGNEPSAPVPQPISRLATLGRLLRCQPSTAPLSPVTGIPPAQLPTTFAEKERKSSELICAKCISDLTGGRKGPQISLNDINVSYN